MNKPDRFYRAGPDHRALLGGVIPDFLTIRQWFDFASVELGKWVTWEEQEQAAGHFFDALSDLTRILAGRSLTTEQQLVLGQQLVSLRGTLGLQYGKGGRPGVSAHYAPLQRTFSLAKNAGPGSIAHEWFHAFDHYMASKAFAEPIWALQPVTFASSLWLENTAEEHPLNVLLCKCFEAIMLAEDGQTPSDLVQASVAVDSKLSVSYYSKPEEMAARSFEAWIQDAAIRNRFLVKGTQQSEEAQLGLYPSGAHRARINQAFSHYFAHLSAALLRQQITTSR
ncbi:CLCA_X family protein [Oceanobacter mangrovi]|uniref:CLCA_X family protein n=1 Tax=Oceanobacter mangrovi TaxID=2862510 RepID=UPI001C8D63A1|nr:CLCA_X family protein [Oceanobacter mangrovi]